MTAIRFIAGSGRSGTTWVQDALANANRLPTIFEPLHPAVSSAGDRYAYRALSAEEEHPELERLFASAHQGRHHPMWTRYRGRPDLLLPSLRSLARPGAARKLYHEWRYFVSDLPKLADRPAGREPIVKCIRANLMLGWVKRRLGGRIVFIVRHPGAVVESQLRLDRAIWDPEPVLQRYRNDRRLDEMTQGRYRGLLGRSLTRVEALAINWVIENQTVLEQAASIGVTVVPYERLKEQPEVEWPRVCQALGLEMVPDQELRDRPSQQVATGRSEKSRAPFRAPGWQRSLSVEQAERIQSILDEAGFDLYSMRDLEVGNGVSASIVHAGTILQS